jgi:type I restriction enzyme S subunit
MAAVEQLVTDHLDLWTSAIKRRSTAGRGSSSKIELYGIKKLRELILELAVRGLLVPQNPKDESASELLKKISAEKIRLVKEKVIRNSRPLAAISESEKFMPLPTGWAFARLHDIGDWGAGATPSRNSPELYGGSIPWFKSGELVADYISQSEESVTELALEKASLRYNKVGDVLIAMYGATIGKTAILSVPATTNQAVCACTPFSGFERTYLLTLLKAYRPRFIGMGAGGAQPNISREKIIGTVVAVPPNAEQLRIVAKVDELMARCDLLEAQTNTSLIAHQTLVEILLRVLTGTGDHAQFTTAWQCTSRDGQARPSRPWR